MVKCVSCQKDDEVKNIMTCAGCLATYHAACLEPDARPKLLEQKWNCPTCTSRRVVHSPKKPGTSSPALAGGSTTPVAPKPNEPVDLQKSTQEKNIKKLMEQSAKTAKMVDSLRALTAKQGEELKLLNENNRAKDIEIEKLKRSLSEQLRVNPTPVNALDDPSDDEDDTNAKLQRLIDANDALLDRVKALEEVPTPGSVSSLRAFENVSISLRRKEIPPLREFSGDPREWPLFETTFNQSTAEGHYSERENADRLRRALKGRASDLVMSKLMFATEASVIMSSLKEAFGDPVKLMSLLTDELMSFPDIPHEKSPILLDFYVKLEAYVANVRAIGKDSELKSEYLLQKLVLKLPFRYQSEFSQLKETTEIVDVCTFRDFVQARQKYLQLQPFSTTSQGASTSSQKARRLNAHHKTDRYQPYSKNGSASNVCTGCAGKHHLTECDNFKRLATPKEKFEFVIAKKICLSCLSSKDHFSPKCPTRRECGKDGCTLPHHRILHGAPLIPRRGSQPQNPQGHEVGLSAGANEFIPNQHQGQSSSSVSHRNNLHQLSHTSSSEVLFKILPVRLHGANNSVVDTFAFLDDGSSVTLLEKSLFDRLQLSGQEEDLNLQWTKGICRSEASIRTSVCVSNPRKKEIFRLTNVYTLENLDLPHQTYEAEELQKRYKHLRGLPIQSLSSARPEILIGLQHSQLLLGSRFSSGRDSDPIGVKTKLGWLVFGNSSPSALVSAVNPTQFSGVHAIASEQPSSDEELHQLVKQYFSTENFGVTARSFALVSKEDIRALQIMEKTMKLVNGRYEIGLLWKRDNVSLPDSFNMAMKRLISLENACKRNPGQLEWMNEHFKELLRKGYARKATKEELEFKWPRVWYCPTFVVFNENKFPPKPRVVTDVAAFSGGVSLNSNLLKGPDNMAPLLKGLLRIRENEVAINADIKEMFSQVRITPEDQQCQRMIWRDGDTSREPTVYISQSMMFGPACSPSCAQHVKNSHAEKFAGEAPEAVQAIIEHTYVDDLMDSKPDVPSATKLANDCIRILGSMGFELVSFQSNSREFLDQLPKDRIKTSLVSLDVCRDVCSTNLSKILGMFWDTSVDVFTFRVSRNDFMTKMLQADYQPTKREILKALMKIFDPCGHIAHFLIRGRIVLQEIWREGVGWDEKVPEKLVEHWRKFIADLPSIEAIKIPRQYAPIDPHTSYVQLIVFVDASEQAYAATAYFRFVADNDVVYVAHAMAKARVAPIKPLTIPQLELQAALLGVRLSKTIKMLSTFKVSETYFMSDSRVVLAWINSKKFNFKTFVASRIGEILEETEPAVWYHVGSKDNVADDATKITELDMSDNDSRWFKGPSFLTQHFESWPVTAATSFAASEVEPVTAHLLHIVRFKFSYDHMMLMPTIYDDIKARFTSCWKSLIRLIAFMLRIVDIRLRKKTFSSDVISPEEFQRAELEVFKKIQLDSFPKEVKHFVEEGAYVPIDFKSSLRSFTPFMDHGLIRMQSRSTKARLSYAATNPPILPNKHPLVERLILHHHEKNLHMGTEMTIADIREKAWIIDIRSAVQRWNRHCAYCVRLKAKPIMPLMGSLPEARVDFNSAPFTHTGVDAFGPYEVKIARSKVKRWGLIFTCLTFRAVHIEVLDDMTADEVIMAIRRFTSRRGKCDHLYSDRGTNFIGAHNLLNQDLAAIEKSLGAAVAEKFDVCWRFQPAYSPWFGGAWERLIQSIKKCIDYVMNKEEPTDAVFRNALIEAELWMNRRPLTHIPIDHEDAPPLTPASVLNAPGREYVPMPREHQRSDEFSRRKSRRADHLASKFLHRWTREYLPEITRRSQWFDPIEPVKCDDIAILIDPSQPKNSWKTVRIVQVYPGADNVIRTVDVEFPDHTKKTRISVGRLAVLKVRASSPPAVQTARGLSSPPRSDSPANA